MADVLNLQEGEGNPETPDEKKYSNPSVVFCSGTDQSNRSWLWC